MRKVWISAGMLVMLAGCGTSYPLSVAQYQQSAADVCPITAKMSKEEYSACLDSPAWKKANALWAGASEASHIGGGPIAVFSVVDTHNNIHTFNEY